MSACYRRAMPAPVLVLLLLVAGCWRNSDDSVAIAPPVAAVEPKEISVHGDVRVDDYYWVRDDTRSDPKVLALLDAENEYTRAVMAHTKTLQSELFNEIAGRLKTEDRTVPVKLGDYFYHREFREGREYPVYVRRQDEPGSVPQVILDVNELSHGHDYYEVANWSVSEDGNVMAFAEDQVGRREYTIRFKDLRSGRLLPDSIEEVESDIAWAKDNVSVFYVAKDPVTLLPYRVFRHVLGTAVEEDKLVYEETDTSFYTSVYASRSHDYVVISMQSTDTSEIRLIDADDPGSAPKMFAPREPGIEYRVRHVPGDFYVLTNWNALNYRLMRTPEAGIGDRRSWTEVIPARDEVLLQDVEVFSDYLVVNERTGGLPHLRVIHRHTGEEDTISFHDPTYTARLHSNPEIETTKLRYVYSSLTTPESVFEYDMAHNTTELLKQDEVLGGFDAARYRSERLFITARDGTQVPVSLVYRPDLRRPTENPMYIYGYGSYGISINPSFQSLRLSLLDRGFVYAIVHVRGGQEMGRDWYREGKLLHKRNTFTDFIDATRELVARGYGARDKVFAGGGSAGGLLMGVIANEAPELYRGIIAHVPFVDVVTTMLDESIPLTSGEFDEWGDPRDKTYYDYMLSYSPYDQVKAQDYPNMFVTTGLWDSQVQYYEPVKWVSRLRKVKTDDNLLLLHIDMNTGHSGASGRYERYRIDALEYAFILDVLHRG